MMRAMSPVWILAVLVAAGCTAPAGGGAPATPPSDTGALVIRTKPLPGLLRTGGAAATPPAFSLYGDGRLISGRMPDSNGVWPLFQQRQVDRAEVTRLLREAADTGLLDGSVPSAAGPDAPVLVVTVASATQRRTVIVPRDAPASRLNDDLSALATGTPTTYEPTAVAVISAANDDPTAPVRPWPLAELTGSPLTGLNAGARCAVLRGADIATVRAAASGTTPATLWRSDDHLWTVLFRPLLPDEPDCTAL